MTTPQRMDRIDQTEDHTITEETLARIYIPAHDAASGAWGSVSVAEASDAQFDAWARSCLNISDDNRVWTTQERIDVCSVYQLLYKPLARVAPALAVEE